MSLTAIIGVSIITVLLTLFLKQYRQDYAIAAATAGGTVLLAGIIIGTTGLLDNLKSVFADSGIDGTLFAAVLKCIGICYITSFAADICRDFGQSALSAKVELAGKVSIVILTFPLIKQILDAALELIG